MMFRSVYLKTLYNLRWQLLGWSLGIGFVAFFTMALYKSFDQPGIDSIVNSVPESLRSLVGSIDDFKTIPGYIGQQIFGPNIYILTIAMSILLAIGVSASEEDDKRLQTLLSMPVTRSSVFCQKWFAIITVIAIVCAVIAASIYLALLAIGETADMERVFQSALACLFMNAAFATVAFGVAMFTGKKGLTITVAGAYTVLSLIVSSLAPAVDELKDIDKLSLLHYYNNPLIMQHGLNLSHLLILGGVTIVLATVSWMRFRRRNIGV